MTTSAADCGIVRWVKKWIASLRQTGWPPPPNSTGFALPLRTSQRDLESQEASGGSQGMLHLAPGMGGGAPSQPGGQTVGLTMFHCQRRTELPRQTDGRHPKHSTDPG